MKSSGMFMAGFQVKSHLVCTVSLQGCQWVSFRSYVTMTKNKPSEMFMGAFQVISY